MAPLVMTISEPQQALLYTPKHWFNWPVLGTVCDTSLNRTSCVLCTLADVGPTWRERIPNGLSAESGYHADKNGISPGQKCPSWSAHLQESARRIEVMQTEADLLASS